MRSYQSKIDASQADLKLEKQKMNKMIHNAAGGQMKTELPTVDPKNAAMNDFIRNPQAQATNSQQLDDGLAEDMTPGVPKSNAGAGAGSRGYAGQSKVKLSINEELRERVRIRDIARSRGY